MARNGGATSPVEDTGSMAYKFNRNCWVESAPIFPCQKTGNLGTSAIFPSVSQRIIDAEKLYSQWERELRADPAVLSRIERLERDLDASFKAMADLGVVKECAGCDAETPEGSCCSRGLENKIDTLLLLVNRLIGVPLQGGNRPESCFFLGANGCLLRVRQTICIDYLCPSLEKHLGSSNLRSFQEISGREVESAFHLMESVKKFFTRFS